MRLGHKNEKSKLATAQSIADRCICIRVIEGIRVSEAVTYCREPLEIKISHHRIDELYCIKGEKDNICAHTLLAW